MDKKLKQFYAKTLPHSILGGAFLTLLICEPTAFAGPPPLEVLSAANSKMGGAKSIYTETSSSDKFDQIIKTATYQRVGSDGTIESRVEKTTLRGDRKVGSTIRITNKDGTWRLFPALAVKMEFLNKTTATALNVTAGSGVAARDAMGLSKLSEVEFNHLPCYMVTQQFSETMQNGLLKSLSQPNAGEFVDGLKERDLKGMIPDRVVYYIGKSDSIIYGQQVFAKSGERLLNSSYDVVSLDSSLSDELFQIPSSSKRMVATSVTEYSQIVAKQLRGESP